jgi:hypothetical protein
MNDKLKQIMPQNMATRHYQEKKEKRKKKSASSIFNGIYVIGKLKTTSGRIYQVLFNGPSFP